MARREERVLRSVLEFVCAWEFVALVTRRIPTISAMVWRASERPLGRRACQALWCAVASYLTVHFWPRRDGRAI